MTFADVLEATMFVALGAFLLMSLFTLASLRWRKYRGESWPVKLARMLRYSLIRAGISLAVAFAFCILLTTALTLNMHRPPADTNPVIRTRYAPGPVKIRLSVDHCGKPVNGLINVSGHGGSASFARIYSDQNGFTKFPVDAHGEGRFTLIDGTPKKGLFSCYLQLPVVAGDHGPVDLKLKLGKDQEVDTLTSVPAPTGFSQGMWHWNCGKDHTCPSLAVIGAAWESGAKQVITLVMAAVFGAIIAVLIAETMLEPVRRRLARIKRSETD